MLLARYGVIPVWMTVVVILREVAISLVRLVRFCNRPLAPDVWGKAKIAVYLVTIIGVLLQRDMKSGGLLVAADSHMPLSSILSIVPGVMLAAVVLTVLSGANYLLRYSGLLTRKNQRRET